MGVNSHPAFDEKLGIKFVWPARNAARINMTYFRIRGPGDEARLFPHASLACPLTLHNVVSWSNFVPLGMDVAASPALACSTFVMPIAENAYVTLDQHGCVHGDIYHHDIVPWPCK